MRISTFPSYPVTAGDLGLAVPAKIMRHIWAALKKLDTIVPGVLPPEHHHVLSGDQDVRQQARLPRPSLPGERQRLHGRRRRRHLARITGAWASGIRAAEGYWAGTDSGRSCRADCGKYPKSSSSYSRDTVCLSPTTVRVFQWPLR